MEGEPSGFPSPRRAKRITRPQAAKSGENRHDFPTFAQLGVNGRREPDFFDKLPAKSQNKKLHFILRFWSLRRVIEREREP